MPDLLSILVEQKIISPAQAQLALADQEVTAMSMEEIVLARGWVTEDVLEKLAPNPPKPPQADETFKFTPGSRTYDQNLKDYRRLMEKILGTSWD